jgi:hypothetical protein
VSAGHGCGLRAACPSSEFEVVDIFTGFDGSAECCREIDSLGYGWLIILSLFIEDGVCGDDKLREGAGAGGADDSHIANAGECIGGDGEFEFDFCERWWFAVFVQFHGCDDFAGNTAAADEDFRGAEHAVAGFEFVFGRGPALSGCGLEAHQHGIGGFGLSGLREEYQQCEGSERVERGFHRLRFPFESLLGFLWGSVGEQRNRSSVGLLDEQEAFGIDQ